MKTAIWQSKCQHEFWNEETVQENIEHCYLAIACMAHSIYDHIKSRVTTDPPHTLCIHLQAMHIEVYT